MSEEIKNLEVLELRMEQALEDPEQVRIADTIIEQMRSIAPTCYKRWGATLHVVMPQSRIKMEDGVTVYCVGGTVIKMETNDADRWMALKIILTASDLYRVAVMRHAFQPSGHKYLREVDSTDDIYFDSLVEVSDRMIARARLLPPATWKDGAA